MKKLFTLTMICVSAAFLVPSEVNAEAMTFNFRGGKRPRVARSLEFSQGGATAIVTGHNSREAQARLVRGRPGLGVYAGRWDSLTVDGFRGRDSVRVDFGDQLFELDTVRFGMTNSRRSRGDSFSLAIDGEIVIADAVAPRGRGLFDVSFKLPAGMNRGTVFEFFTVNRLDSWTLSSISGNLAGGASAAPEPASLLLIGLGAGGVALARRRRRSKEG